MKKILLLAVLSILIGLNQVSRAQCNFSGAGVRLNGAPYTDPVTGKCMINIDLYFDLKSDPGGKYVYVHIWPSASYPNLAYCHPPTASELTNSVATLGFYHFQESLYLLSAYTPVPGIANYLYTGLVIQKGPSSLPGYDRFSISNVAIASPQACSIPQSFLADAWMSQSAQAQNVHCFSKGLSFYANDPKITGLLFCQLPRTFTFTISTITSTGLTVAYKVFLDNGDGFYNKVNDSIKVAEGSNILLNAGNSYRFTPGVLGYLPWSNQSVYADRSLWIVVTSSGAANESYARVDNSCIPLPVTLQSFQAYRNKKNVELYWNTASESNNSGFYVERKTGAGNWEIAGFVPSLGVSGNSDEELNYTFVDFNPNAGISSYRLKQTDLDGRIVFSPERLVKGWGQSAGVMVYPNPVRNGAFTVLFDRISYPFTIELLDMQGRMVRRWANYNANSLVITDLPNGVYALIIRGYMATEPVTTRIVVAH
jgi:hypothetical protein